MKNLFETIQESFGNSINEGAKISDKSIKANLDLFHQNITMNLTDKVADKLDKKATELFMTDELSDLSMADSKALAKAVLKVYPDVWQTSGNKSQYLGSLGINESLNEGKFELIGLEKDHTLEDLRNEITDQITESKWYDDQMSDDINVIGARNVEVTYDLGNRGNQFVDWMEGILKGINKALGHNHKIINKKNGKFEITM